MKSNNIIFVHGMFGWGNSELGGLSYWGKALDLAPTEFKIHAPSCGPISSFHDRACEVAAQIKGTQVDYGKEHSDRANHKQFSFDYTPEKSGKKPLIEHWSEDNPAILVGHSAGGHTCLQLQQLLADDYWNWGSKANWVEAVILISPVLNGSTLTYKFGCDKKSGLLNAPIGEFINHSVQFLELIGKPHIYDFDLEHWIGPDHKSDSKEIIIEALEGSDYAKGEDNLAFDLTLQGCYNANDRFNTFPDTYYLSIVTEQTTNGVPDSPFFKLWKPGMHRILVSSAKYQGLEIDFEEAPIPDWGSGDLIISKWRENDGAVSSISQKYPFTAGNHPVGGEDIFSRNQLDKGAWYFEVAEKITGRRFDHFDATLGYRIPLIRGPSGSSVAHKMLYEKIYSLLNKL